MYITDVVYTDYISLSSYKHQEQKKKTYLNEMTSKILVTCALLSSMIALTYSTAYTSTKEFRPDNQSPSLKPEEMYRDMFVLSRENFTDTILRHRDPWVIIFHDGTLDKAWKTMAATMRGILWFGLVDITVDNKFLGDLMYSRTEDKARVYPYGDRNVKERKWTRVQNQNEAVTVAMSRFPDRTHRITGNDVNDLYTDSFLSIPSKFPVYLITDDEETSHLFKAIAARFDKYFYFGKVVKPSEEEKEELGIGDREIGNPSLFVMVSGDGTLERVNAIQFDENKHGVMNYTNIIQFLFAINFRYRHFLPGQNLADRQQEAEMADIVRIEEKRFDIRFPKSDSSSRSRTMEPPKTVRLKPTVTNQMVKDEL